MHTDDTNVADGRGPATEAPRATSAPSSSRRSFLAGTGWLAAAGASATLPRTAHAWVAPPPAARDVLVVVFLRGGMDGLTLCAPYGDADLYVNRPNTGVRPPGQFHGAIDLDGFFGLAPAAAALRQPYLAGQLAIVHACGSTDPTRSHFDAMKFVEAATPNQPSLPTTTGWLGRYLASTSPVGDGTLRAVALDHILPRALAGGPATLPIADLDGFTMPGAAASAARRRATLASMYGTPGEALGATASGTFATIARLDAIDFAGYTPQNGANYPATLFGQRMRDVAALVKADVGVECVSVDFHGWDLHVNLGPFDGLMAMLMSNLAESLTAFWKDMGAGMQRVTVVAMTEFGRRVRENGSGGLDHGHGTLALVLGGGIVGGQVRTQWPGLGPTQLDQGDLRVTIDYRDVLAEILTRRLGATDLSSVFPNHTPLFPGITI